MTPPSRLPRRLALAALVVLCVLLTAPGAHAQGVRPRLMTQGGHAAEVRSLAFSPDGRLLASGAGDGAVRLWAVGAGAAVRVLDHPFRHPEVAFSADGRFLAARDVEGAVVWDVATGAEVAVPGVAAGEVRAVAFGPDGPVVAAWGREDGAEGAPPPGPTVRVVSATGAERFRAPVAAYADAAFSPDGRLLATGGGGDALRVVDARTGAVRPFESPGEGLLGGLAFSADGRTLVGNGDHVVYVWDVASGRIARRFTDPDNPLELLTLSADGQTLATVWGGGGGSILLAEAPDGRQMMGSRVVVHDLETGAEAARLDVWNVGAGAVALAGDRLAVVERDGVRLRDRQTGAVVQTVRRWADAVERAMADDGEGYNQDEGSVVAVSPDGALVAVGLLGGTVALVEAATGRERAVLGREVPTVSALAFSPDGQSVAVGGASGAGAELWGPDGVVRVGGPGDVGGLAFSADGRFLAAANATPGAGRVYDVAAGADAFAFEGATAGVAFAPDDAGGRPAVVAYSWSTADRGDTWRARDAETGAERAHVEVGPGETAVGQSDAGLAVAIRDAAGVVRVVDLATGREVGRRDSGLPDGPGPHATVEAVADDGRAVLLTVRRALSDPACVPDADAACAPERWLWEPASGAERRLGAPVSAAAVAVFSPDGRRLVLMDDNPPFTTSVWDTATGRPLWTQRPAGGDVGVGVHFFPAFSPDGRLLAGPEVGDVGALVVRDAETGAEVSRIATGIGEAEVTGGERPVFAFSPDGRSLLLARKTGAADLVDVATGATAASLLAFEDGTWAVVDPEGRFDASDGGDVAGLAWVLDTPGGMEPVGLSQLKDRYYDPGLLAKVLGASDEPLRDVGALGGVRLYPDVEVAATPAGVRVRLTDRGGGIGPVQVLLNGTEVAADARPAGPVPDSLTVDLAPFRRFFLPDTLNTVEVVAANAEGSLRSRPAGATFTAPAARGDGVEVAEGDGEAYAPHLWAVVAGVGDYAGEALDLRYAGKDAADFADALGVAGAALFTAERTHVALLTTEARPGAARPSAPNLLAALDAVAARADARDVLVVYLAGHGVVHGGPEGDFYFLAADATSGTLADAAVRASVAVSSDTLTARVARIPALKRALIFDTCASGRVVERLSEPRDVPGAQVRSLERMKDRTGTFVLAGSSADAVSYEASRFGQGLLTYSLLAGIHGAALREDVEVDVAALFAYAADRVPQLARSIGGVQRPTVAAPRGGGSFAVGHVGPAEQARMAPVAAPRPVVVRAGFQDEARFDDPLGLTRAVNEALRAADYAGARDGGPGPALVFVDADGYPEAYRVVGRYAVDGEAVRVTARLFLGDEARGSFEAAGTRADVGALAADVVARAAALLE